MDRTNSIKRMINRVTRKLCNYGHDKQTAKLYAEVIILHRERRMYTKYKMRRLLA